ncbi:MAG: hypothetical protein JWM40_33, partial [Frankiales bacterium]|nr:hypothetical protein [Frankiales bacterium]
GGIGAGLATADTKVLYEAYLQDINAHGGVLGRRLVGVYRKLSPTASLASIAQDVCTYYSQDHKVSFVFSPPLLDMYGCLSKAGIAALSSTPQNVSKQLLRRWPLALLPESLAMDHYSDIEAKEFTAMGFFHHGLTDKLGVIYFENDAASVDGFGELQKALPRYGTKIDYTEALTFADGTSGLAAMEASVQAAELKFSAEGVTEVICVEVNAFACGFFGVYASSQGYYPRYAFSGAQVLSNIVANVPAKELADSVFLGWFPAQDLQHEAEMPAPLRACFGFFRKRGVTVSTGNQRSQTEQACADVNFFLAAIRAAPAVSAAGLIKGAELIGLTYTSIGTFGVKISANQRDGVSRIRRGAFVTSCDCFRYTSNPAAV